MTLTTEQATFYIAAWLAVLQLFRFLGMFQSKRADVAHREQDERLRLERQAVLDEKLGEIKEAMVRAADELKRMNGSVNELKEWREIHIQEHKHRDELEETKGRRRRS
jgi:hypothetical protein